MVQYAWKKRWTIWPKYGFSMFNSLKLIGRAAWYPILSHPTVPGWLECACPRSCSKIPPSSWEKHMPICVWRRAFEADHPYRLSLHVHRAIVPVYHGFSDFSYQGSLMLWVVCFRKLHWQNLMMRVAHQTFCDQTLTLEICILFGRRSSKLSASCARKFSVCWVRLSWLIPEINTQVSHVFTSWTSSHYISARWTAPVFEHEIWSLFASSTVATVPFQRWFADQSWGWALQTCRAMPCRISDYMSEIYSCAEWSSSFLFNIISQRFWIQVFFIEIAVTWQIILCPVVSCGLVPSVSMSTLRCLARWLNPRDAQLSEEIFDAHPTKARTAIFCGQGRLKKALLVQYMYKIVQYDI